MKTTLRWERGPRPTPERAPTGQAPSWWRLALVGVFVLALLFRVWAIVRLSGTPLLDSLRSDSEVYWAWAIRLSQQGWIGHNPFFLAPLYPYWLALVQQAIGPSVLGVLLIQSVLGAAAVSLLADAACLLTSPRVGIAIGVLAAGYEGAIFFDTLVLTESLLFTSECLLLWLVVRWPWRSRPVGGALSAGAIIGIAAYGRGTELLLMGPLLLLIWQVVGHQRQQALMASAAAIAVVVALALPGLVRHKALVGEWILYTYSSGLNLYIGNGPQANGTYVVADVQDSGPLEGDGIEGGTGQDGRAGLLSMYGLRLSPAASSAYFARLTRDSIQRHPLRWLQVMGAKLLMLFNYREQPQVESVELHRALIGPLGIPIVGSFAMAALVGLLGLVWVRSSDERWGFTIGYLFAMSLGIAAFFVVDRYRHHLVPALLLLGAATLQSVSKPRVLAGRQAIVRNAPIVALAGALVFWPLPAKSTARLKWDLATRLGEAWLQKGRPDLALAHFNGAVTLDTHGTLAGSESTTGRTARALLYENRAIALWQLGRMDEAAQSLARGIAVDPHPELATEKLVELDVLRGRFDEAEAVLARASISKQVAVRVLLDDAREEEGRSPERTIAYLRGAVAIDSTSEVGWMALVRALVQGGKGEEARAALNRAERSGIDPLLIYVHRALIEAREGKLEAARSWLAKVPADRLRKDPRLAMTVALIRASASGR
jgi:tetratricopeptide (TPR) repeat protein